MRILKKKTAQSTSGFVYANNDRGKPIKLVQISQPQTGSSKASASTLKKPSQAIERLTECISSPAKEYEDVITQTAASIKRNQQYFLNSISETGLNIMHRFTLKQVCKLSFTLLFNVTLITLPKDWKVWVFEIVKSWFSWLCMHVSSAVPENFHTHPTDPGAGGTPI